MTGIRWHGGWGHDVRSTKAIQQNYGCYFPSCHILTLLRLVVRFSKLALDSSMPTLVAASEASGE